MTLNCKNIIFLRHALNVTLMFSALLTLCLYSLNDVISKCYYTSVISFLLNGYITLLLHVLCDKVLYHIKHGAGCNETILH